MVPETLSLDTLVTGDIALVLSPGALCVTDTLPACPPAQHYPVLTRLAAIIPVAKMRPGVYIRFTIRGISVSEIRIRFPRSFILLFHFFIEWIVWIILFKRRGIGLAGVGHFAVFHVWLTVTWKMSPALGWM